MLRVTSGLSITDRIYVRWDRGDVDGPDAKKVSSV